MELRGYLPSDLDALVALDDLCFDPPFRFSHSAMRRFVTAKNARVTVAEDADGSLAGFCVLHIEQAPPHTVGYIVTLDVAPKHRRRGLAGELMARAEQQALAAGCEAVALHVFTGNATAIRFYERRGYTFSHRAASFYARGVDALVYCKQLGPLPLFPAKSS
jgi:ribosomal-protein-alanine N-acetyltransferase